MGPGLGYPLTGRRCHATAKLVTSINLPRMLPACRKLEESPESFMVRQFCQLGCGRSSRSHCASTTSRCLKRRFHQPYAHVSNGEGPKAQSSDCHGSPPAGCTLNRCACKTQHGDTTSHKLYPRKWAVVIFVSPLRLALASHILELTSVPVL